MGLSTLPDIPPTGWRLLRVVDVRFDEWETFSEYFSCEYCDNERVRFRHELVHPQTQVCINVGYVCAGYLTQDHVTVAREEQLARRRTARFLRFVTRDWTRTRLGGVCKSYRGHWITVGNVSGGFAIWLDSVRWERLFDTAERAKLTAYHHVEALRRK